MTEEPTDDEIRRIAAKLGAPMPPGLSPSKAPAAATYEYVMGGGCYHIMKISGSERKFLRTVHDKATAWEVIRRLKAGETVGQIFG